MKKRRIRNCRGCARARKIIDAVVRILPKKKEPSPEEVNES